MVTGARNLPALPVQLNLFVPFNRDETFVAFVSLGVRYLIHELRVKRRLDPIFLVMTDRRQLTE